MPAVDGGISRDVPLARVSRERVSEEATHLRSDRTCYASTMDSQSTAPRPVLVSGTSREHNWCAEHAHTSSRSNQLTQTESALTRQFEISYTSQTPPLESHSDGRGAESRKRRSGCTQNPRQRPSDVMASTLEQTARRDSGTTPRTHTQRKDTPTPPDPRELKLKTYDVRTVVFPKARTSADIPHRRPRAHRVSTPVRSAARTGYLQGMYVCMYFARSERPCDVLPTSALCTLARGRRRRQHVCVLARAGSGMRDKVRTYLGVSMPKSAHDLAGSVVRRRQGTACLLGTTRRS